MAAQSAFPSDAIPVWDFTRPALRMLGKERDGEDGVGVWRKRGRQPEIEADAEVEFAPAAEGSAQLRIDLDRALRRLSPEMRSVVVVRFSEDLAYEEIAHVRGASVNTVKTQLARAKRVMREELKGAWS
ncbi:MAG: sigma factor-like helix-turn-helix DNA-binding protein [Candidatus Binatia bacterium]|nr:sigma factor-like helix-turn-helix DNA-binding protein [Candidatus Binatia bacterium]